MAEWRLLAGDMSPVEAVGLEAEVRTYAASVEALDGLGDDVPQAEWEKRLERDRAQRYHDRSLHDIQHGP